MGRLPPSTCGLARGVAAFRGGSGAPRRRIARPLGGTIGASSRPDGVLRPPLRPEAGWPVGLTNLGIGGKGDRREDSCDGETRSHVGVGLNYY